MSVSRIFTHTGREVRVWLALQRESGASAEGTHPFVKVIAAKLDSRVRNNAYAVGSITSHETSPTFLPPHFGKALAYRQLVGISSDTLHLKQNLETF